MRKTKRTERIAAMIKILTDSPGKVYTYAYFCELFDVAKSSVSEDVDVIQDAMEAFSLGSLETLTGASGGVRYVPQPSPQASDKFINELCMRLSDPERILPGGFLYMVDVLSDPVIVSRMAEIMASWYRFAEPDVVITVETKGIPVALMVARLLNVPLVVARTYSRITDGSVVTINYITGTSSSRNIQTMSLPKRAIKTGSKALIIDDFMKGGGTARGMMDLMQEFSVKVIGIGVVMDTEKPDHKMITSVKSLMTLYDIDETTRRIDVRPAKTSNISPLT